MKKAQFDLNMALSVQMNILRLRRWINRHLSKQVRPRVPSGSARFRMAYRANLKRLNQDRQFRFNAFRNPVRKRQEIRCS